MITEIDTGIEKVEVSMDKVDVGVQFNYIVPMSGNLACHGMT